MNCINAPFRIEKWAGLFIAFWVPFLLCGSGHVTPAGSKIRNLLPAELTLHAKEFSFAATLASDLFM